MIDANQSRRKAPFPASEGSGAFFRSVSYTSLTCGSRIAHAEGVHQPNSNLDRLGGGCFPAFLSCQIIFESHCLSVF
jgi:hypothetical protein